MGKLNIDLMPVSGDIIKTPTHHRRVVDCRLMEWHTKPNKNLVRPQASGNLLTGEIPDNDRQPEDRISNRYVVTYSKGGGRVHRCTLSSWRLFIRRSRQARDAASEDEVIKWKLP